MDAYTSFAEVYDLFQDNIPYEEWSRYLISLLKDQGIHEGIVLDLGCGTGTVTEILAKAGYDMIGIDNSEEMLNIAMEKKEREEMEPYYDKLLYLCQDMREIELFGTVKAVVSICDSMNYITSYEDLVKVFQLVNNYLDPGCPFIFDMNTYYKYKNVLADHTFAEVREESSFIWDNYFDEKTGINEYDLTLFIREEEDFPDEDGRFLSEESEEERESLDDQDYLYRRFHETHFQKAYTLEEVKRAAEEAGMIWVDAYEAFTREPAGEKTERMYVILREHGNHQRFVEELAE